MSVAVMGRRGTGKTTWCYRLCGLVPPQTPPGTASLSYLTCTIADTEYKFWDFPPGLDSHYTNILNDMDYILLCYNGRPLSDSVDVLKRTYPNAQLMILVTSCNILSMYHLYDWAQTTFTSVPVCYTEMSVWNELTFGS